MNEQLPPELIQQILMAGQQTPEDMQAQRKQAMIDRLREGAMAPNQNQVAGGRVIPNWSDNIPKLMGAYLAKKGQPEVDAVAEKGFNRGMQARTGYFGQLSNALRRPLPQQPPPAMMSPQQMPMNPNMPGAGY